MKELNEARKTYEDTPIPAAACFCLVLAGLNLSPTVAQAAAQVPVLGGLFRVLTFVEYDRTEDGIHYDVSAPHVEAEGGLAEKVNAAIQEKLDVHLVKAQQDWDSYRDAFFATGGGVERPGDGRYGGLRDQEPERRSGFFCRNLR